MSNDNELNEQDKKPVQNSCDVMTVTSHKQKPLPMIGKHKEDCQSSGVQTRHTTMNHVRQKSNRDLT